jgi:AcrR family transcriptional regulator
MLDDSDMRKKILAKARKIFVAQGYEGASMKMISDAAGCTKSVLYYYFSDKAALWQEVKGEVLKGFDTSRAGIFTPRSSTLGDFLKDVIEQRLLVLAQSNEVVRMVLWQRLELSEQVELAPRTVAEHPWIAAVVSLQKKGEIRADLEPVFVVNLLLGVSSAGVIFFARPLPKPQDIANYCAQSIKMLSSFLTAE